jgi:hypothetical protein
MYVCNEDFYYIYQTKRTAGKINWLLIINIKRTAGKIERAPLLEVADENHQR